MYTKKRDCGFAGYAVDERDRQIVISERFLLRLNDLFHPNLLCRNRSATCIYYKEIHFQCDHLNQ